MGHRAYVVGAVAALWCVSASAFYSGLTPPSGWTAGGGPGGQMAGAIANAQASSKFTGSVTKIPVAMRYASGAARFAVRSILGGGIVGAGVIAAEWLAENCFEKRDGQWVRTCFPDGSGPKVSDGYEWSFAGAPMVGGAQQYWPSKVEACYFRLGQLQARFPDDASKFSVGRCGPAGGATGAGEVVINFDGAPYSELPLLRKESSCPAGWYMTPAGCVQTPPPVTVTPTEIEEEMAPKPIPPGLPDEIPKTPLPIEIPTINPDPENPTQPKPWREPAGNPVPIPDTQPQRYKQPWTEITPAPTQTDPWRVDVQPKSTETESPTPVQPQGIGPSPSPSPTDGKPEEKDPDLCEKNPDIIACQKLEFDTPDAPDLPQKDMGGPITPDSGWGAADAQCPAPRHISVQGRDVPIPFDLFCQYMAGLRPVILAMAWLSAAFIFVGGIRSGD